MNKIYTNKFTLEQILYTNYIKYDKLTELVNEAFKGSNANSIHLYIDLYSIFKGLYNNQTYDIMDYTVITSSIINLVAHMKSFFRKRYRVESKVYLVYSKNCPYINNQFYPEYNKKKMSSFNSNKLIDDMIESNIKLLKILCPYLPDIHFISGTFETGVTIYDLICRNELQDNNPHIVLTRDSYNYQLAAMRDNITIFRPKKYNGKDESYFINQNNLINTYLMERKTEYRTTTLMPGLLSLLMTLSSVQERNIKMLFNIKTSVTMLEKAIADYKILNGYNSNIGLVYNGLYSSKLEKISDITFEHRFKAIDIQSQHMIYLNTAEPSSISLENLYDPEEVKEINNKYFISNPLDLMNL